MSTYNTYVGARYVPLLVGDWDTTKQTEYEPLTVVQYQGNSYTSRTYVPKNIDIINTEYWVVTGNYNAQIEAYREEIEKISNKLDSLQKTYPDKTFLLFGDSLFDGYTPDNSIRHGWGYWLEQYLTNKGYTVHLATDIKTTPYGSAFAGDKTYVMHLHASLEAHPEYATENITDVIVYTGTNDATHTTTETETGISNFVAEIKKYWPNASIKIGFFGAIHNYANKSVDTLFKNVCGKYGCTYIANGYLLASDKSKVSSDNVHLSVDGYKYYSPYLAEGALSGNLKYTFYFSDIPISANSNFTLSSAGLSLKIENGKLYGCINNIGGGFGILNIVQSGGTYPALLTGTFDNPLNFTINHSKMNTESLFNAATELSGTVTFYTGYSGDSNTIALLLIGKNENTTARIYATEYVELSI